MTLSTYSDLTTSIANWMGRTGDPNLPVDDFVTIFEADASTKLRTHFQEVQTTITTVQGTPSYNLPSDFLEAREVSLTSTDPTRVLKYMDPASMDDFFAFADNGGQPYAYTLEDTQIRFAPIPDGVYTARLEYTQSIPSLHANTTNWLFTNYPQCYLYGSLIAAYVFTGEDGSSEKIPYFTSLRDEIYDKIRLSDRKFRQGSAPLQMRIDIWGR